MYAHAVKPALLLWAVPLLLLTTSVLHAATSAGSILAPQPALGHIPTTPAGDSGLSGGTSPLNWTLQSHRSSPGMPAYGLRTRSRSAGSCSLAYRPGWLAYDAADSSLWVATPPDCIDVFPTLWSLPMTSLPVGSDPFGVAVDNSTNDVFVTNTGSDNVTVISAATNTSVANISVGAQPMGVAYDSATGDVYVANSGSNNVTVISGTSLQVVAWVGVGSDPVGVAADPQSGQVFVANNASDNVSAIDAETYAVAATVPTGGGPWGVALDNATDQIFVTDSATSNISVISGSGDFEVRSIPVVGPGFSLQGLAYDAQTQTVWIGAGNWYLVMVNASSLTVVGFDTVDPSGVAYDPSDGDMCVTEVANFTFACINFIRFPATVLTFHEAGLPAGTPWSVDLGSGFQESTTDNASFGIIENIYYLNETYDLNFTVPMTADYAATPGFGDVSVGSLPVEVNITFALAAGFYPVTFLEVGLPYLTAWSVDLNGTVHRSTSNTNVVWEPNGTYSYTVEPVGGYFASYLGEVQVDGTPVTANVSFLPTFALWFNETGLPLGTNWSVSLNNSLAPYQTIASTGPSIRFQLPNGSGAYGITAIPGYSTEPWTGGYHVQGRSLTIAVAWSEVVYSVVFNQTGLQPLSLPPVDPFSVTLNGTEEEGFGDSSVVFSEPNGSYPFFVTPPMGWSVAPHTGTVSVQGQAVVQTLNFSVVIPPLSVNFTYPIPSTCDTPFNVTFTSNVSGGAPPYSYSWNFDDGSPASNQADPTHEFPYAAIIGTTVTLEALDADGTMASHSETLLVHVLNCTVRYVPPLNGNASSSSAVVTALAIVTVGVIAASVVVLLVVYRKRQP